MSIKNKVAKKNSHPSAETKQLLIEAARCLFSRQGYHATSVRELAEQAGVNICLISYHFGGKEGLYKTCLEGFGKSLLDAAEKILVKPLSSEDFKVRTQLFILALIEYFGKEPDLIRMAQHEFEIDNPIVDDLFSKTFLKIYERLILFFKSSQQDGLITKQFDPQIATTFLFGALSNFARTDVINRKYFKRSIYDEAYRKKVAEDTYNLLLSGLGG